MTIRRTLTVPLVAAALLSVVAIRPVSAAVSAVGGGAHALRAAVDVLGVSASIGPVSSVDLPAAGGGPLTASVLSTSPLGLATVGLMQATTEGGVAAGSSTSSATVLGVEVAGLITANVASSRCRAGEDGASGASTVVDLVVAGFPISVLNPGPNTTIELPVAKVVLNEQTTTSAGGRTAITVTAVRVTLDAFVLTADVELAQSRCEVTST